MRRQVHPPQIGHRLVLARRVQHPRRSLDHADGRSGRQTGPIAPAGWRCLAPRSTGDRPSAPARRRRAGRSPGPRSSSAARAGPLSNSSQRAAVTASTIDASGSCNRLARCVWASQPRDHLVGGRQTFRQRRRCHRADAGDGRASTWCPTGKITASAGRSMPCGGIDVGGRREQQSSTGERHGDRQRRVVGDLDDRQPTGIGDGVDPLHRIAAGDPHPGLDDRRAVEQRLSQSTPRAAGGASGRRRRRTSRSALRAVPRLDRTPRA